MGAVAGMALAIGSALFFLGGLAIVVLCRAALRQGAEFEGEIKARSFRLKVKPYRPVVRDLGLRSQEDPVTLESQHDRGDTDIQKH
jgi:hypothetical protein